MMALDRLRALGLLDALDVRFAEALGRLGGTNDPDVLLGAALASRALSCGDVGVDLERIGATLAETALEPLPPMADAEWWRARLRGADGLVRLPEEPRTTPLILDGHDLYLERTWAYQERLAGQVRARLAAPARPVDLDHLANLVGRLQFEDPRSQLQLRALVTATLRGFALIAGGPGTGKTAVVTKLVAALQDLETRRTGRPLRVRLAAPTGKAAARMSEAIRERAESWLPEDLRQGVHGIEASTLHRLLGWRGGTRFQHHAENPLALDLLIVDEASMVDLPLMTKLLEAVRPTARVLLLGDPDQLASVEVGAVFADLCQACAGAVSAPLQAAWDRLGCGAPGRGSTSLDPLPGDALTRLEYTWRYAAGSGIEALADAIHAGDGERAVQVLEDGELPDVSLVEADPAERLSSLEAQVVGPYVAVGKARDPQEALERVRAVRVLAAHREGLSGVNALNAHLNREVRARLDVPAEVDGFAGRPIMITHNDHPQRLYNGDVGVVFAGDLRVWFETADGAGRAVPPALLPEHDTVFVTTVHKSQGSEYGHVVLVLPPQASAVTTREWLYTAVTRATERVTIIGPSATLRAAIGRKTTRMSRLAERVVPCKHNVASCE